MENIPDEMTRHIFTFLDTKECCRIKNVSTIFNNIVNTELLDRVGTNNSIEICLILSQDTIVRNMRHITSSWYKKKCYNPDDRIILKF